VASAALEVQDGGRGTTEASCLGRTDEGPPSSASRCLRIGLGPVRADGRKASIAGAILSNSGACAFGVHEEPPIVSLGLELIVGAAAQLEIVELMLATLGVGLPMVKLEQPL